MKGKSHITSGGRNHPYEKGGGATRDKACGCCARQHSKEVQCPASDQTCFNCKDIGHLKAACRNLAAAASASTAEEIDLIQRRVKLLQQ